MDDQTGRPQLHPAQVRLMKQWGYDTMSPPEMAQCYSALRFQPLLVGFLLLLALFSQFPPLVAVVAAMLVWAAAVPKQNPFNLIYNSTLRPMAQSAPLGPDPAPRRFGAGLYGGVLVVATLAFFVGLSVPGLVLTALVLAASMAVLLGNTCVGSAIYHLLNKSRS